MDDSAASGLVQAARDARTSDRRGNILKALLHWEEQGLKLGYPQCCIDFFLDRAYALYFMPVKTLVKIPPEWPMAGTGYVPCPMCAAQFTDEELTARIAERRSTDVAPFPEYDE